MSGEVVRMTSGSATGIDNRMDNRIAMRIDAHQHYWQLTRGDYGWLPCGDARLDRDYLPSHLQPELRALGFHGSILVQAAPTIAETIFLLRLAQEEPSILGVVGWVDLAAEELGAQLDQLGQVDEWEPLEQAEPLEPLEQLEPLDNSARLERPAAGGGKLVGIRPMLQDLPEDDWILQPRVLSNLRQLAKRGLVLDLLTFPRHLPSVGRLLAEIPNLRAVVDHVSKPPISAGGLEPWKSDLRQIATHQQVYCKLSGMVTEAGANWQAEQLRPYVEHVLDVFGPDRVMFGSDWPVSLQVASYRQVFDALVSNLPPDWLQQHGDKLFGLNAARFYGIHIV